jgi:hypothetical protein
MGYEIAERREEKPGWCREGNVAGRYPPIIPYCNALKRSMQNFSASSPGRLSFFMFCV